jgi:hypothetical protein
MSKEGHEVEVEVPSQSSVDIHTGKAAEEKVTPTRGRVSATVVAVDTVANRIKVETAQGQIIELDLPAKDMNLGETVTLVVP